jgi:hypothetical protein
MVNGKPEETGDGRLEAGNRKSKCFVILRTNGTKNPGWVLRFSCLLYPVSCFLAFTIYENKPDLRRWADVPLRSLCSSE